jgi:hypothetical protein
MQHSEFKIGTEFWCSGRQWRCTDIGARTIVAIRLDRVEVVSALAAARSGMPERRRILSRGEAEAEGWFNGPPYAVAESVFDEYDIEGCSLEPEESPE